MNDYPLRDANRIPESAEAARRFCFFVTLAGPDAEPYPGEPANVYYARKASNVKFTKEAGYQTVTYDTLESYDHILDLVTGSYLEEGSLVLCVRMFGQWYTWDKVPSECACGDFPIFVMGGYPDASDNDSYDPTGDAWKSVTDLVSPGRHSHAAMAEAGTSNIFAFGGTGLSGSLTDADKYDALADTWASVTSLGTARGRPRCGVIGADGYVVNDLAVGGASHTTRYTFASDTYAARTAHGHADQGIACGWSSGSRLYMAARAKTGTNWLHGELAEYDPAGNVWTTSGEIPYESRTGSSSLDDWYFREGAVAIVPDGTVCYMVTGVSQAGGTVTPNRKYTVASNTWTTSTVLPSPGRSDGAAAMDGLNGYVIGGADGSSAALALNAQFDTSGLAWSLKTPLPSPARFLHSAVNL